MALWRSAGSCVLKPITYNSCTAQLDCFLGRGGGVLLKIRLSWADDTVTSIKKTRNKRIHNYAVRCHIYTAIYGEIVVAAVPEPVLPIATLIPVEAADVVPALEPVPPLPDRV